MMRADEMDPHTQWEEAMPAAEQLALTDFAAFLGTYISLQSENNEEEDVREEAQLLMSLLSATPPPPKRYEGPDDDGSRLDHDAFSFTCPLLSLDSNLPEEEDSKPTHDTSEDNEGSPAPALLLGRRLAVDNRGALRQSAEAMARNILQSFQKALKWRIQTWIHSLSCSLVQKEKELKDNSASEEVIRELLDTPEARLYLCLRKAASDIEVVDTSTRFRVLSQKINCAGAPPLKKRKAEEPSTLQTETEYKYTVAYVLSFETVMNLKTPAGYTEVTLEAPGVIEGTFLSLDYGGEILTGVSVEVDTNVIAAAIEQSSRVVARSATHATIPTQSEEEEEDIKVQEPTQEAMPTPTKQTEPSVDDDAPTAALVTPRKSSPTYCDSDNEVTPKNSCLPIPDDLDNHNDVIRMVSPQPRSPEFNSFAFTPRTPNTSKMSHLPLVSPPPSAKETVDENSDDSERKSPSLPALVQVACAAMYAC